MRLAKVRSEIEGVRIIELKKHADDRGFFMETFHVEHFREMGLPESWAQANQSFSYHGVLRGMHMQAKNPQGKLIRPMYGTIYDAFVDLREGSPTYGKWDGLWLNWEEPVALYLPPGLAHGFFTASAGAILSYLCTTTYDAESDGGIAWDDPDVGIEWPFPEDFVPIVSTKDSALPRLAQLRGAGA